LANLVVHNTANDVPRSVFSSTIDHSMIKTVEFPRTVIETKFLTGDVAFHRRPFSTNRTHWLYVIEKSARAKLGSRKKDFENNGHCGATDVYTVLAVTSALALTTVDGRQANDTKKISRGLNMKPPTRSSRCSRYPIPRAPHRSLARRIPARRSQFLSWRRICAWPAADGRALAARSGSCPRNDDLLAGLDAGEELR
jgi:hypothetical protein